MSYTLTITKTNVDVPSISGDLAPEDLEDFMPSSVFGSTYIVDLLFELSSTTVDGEGVPTESPVSINSIISSTPGRTGVTFTVIDSDPFAYKLRVQGVLDEPIFQSKYNIVTNSFINLIDVTTLPENFLAIFRWTPPSVFWFLFSDSFRFIVNPDDVSETEVLLSQYLYWDWNTGITTFTTDLAKGLL